MEAIRSVDAEYELETLEKILEFLREEVCNIEYSKTKKIASTKRRIRKK